ncbi:MAG: gamma-glutamyltransferase [Candidatus Bathyarchaeia archaeon]
MVFPELIKPQLAGVAGEVPILLYWADEEQVIAINGQGPAPKNATIEWFKEHRYPMIPGLGFCMGTRAQMLYLDPDHVECLEPGKKPSTTLTPSLVTDDNEPYMTFGTPGGDRQDQRSLQFFLNYVDFGMNLQESLDALTIHINHFPASF